jgi:alkanesulfonate monooxygenase SsuD/methylene tetrahydromethanopterin reductase-like flavin-dependent oxidoreductase (luciferase family)
MFNSVSSIGPAAGRPLKVGFFLPVAESMLNGDTPRWADLLAMARQSEEIEIDSLWVMDHVLMPGPVATLGAWDCWSLLAGLAAVTNRVAIGPLVSCTSFRNPALQAKIADTVDEISGGRLILGLGAGWNQREYEAFGYPFDHRVSRFAEAIAIIHGLLREGRVDFEGKYYQARDCQLVPRGPQGHQLPILVGGRGERMLRLAARYADSWNSDWAMPADLSPMLAALDVACREVGRDPSTLERTGAVRIEFPGLKRQAFDDTRGQISGTTEELATLLRSYATAGIGHLIVWLFPNVPESIEAFAPVLELLDRG